MTRFLVVLLLCLVPMAATAVPAGAAPADCAQAGVSDVDGDGAADAVAGDPLADAGDRAGAGAVLLLPAAGGVGALPDVPQVQAGDGYGWTVRTGYLDADRCLDVVVGAPYTDVAGVRDAGAVYLLYGGRGREPVRIEPPRPEQDAHFGWAVSVGARTLAVGAPHQDADGVTDSGAVYVYRLDAQGKPGQPRMITQNTENVIGNSEPGDGFGWALALGRLGGDPNAVDLAVGVPYENDDGAGPQSGQGTADVGSLVCLFDVTGTVSSKKWLLHEATEDVPATAGDLFGLSLAYTEWQGNGYLAVSAPLADAGGVADSGMVQLFRRSGKGTLAPLRTVVPGKGPLAKAAPTRGATLGRSLAFLAVAGTLTLAAGAPGETVAGAAEAGAVRRVTVAGPQDDAAGGTVAEPAGEARPGERFGAALTAIGGLDEFAPGTILVVGAPDEGLTGAVAFLTGGRLRLVRPAHPAPVDFGAALG